MSMKPEDTAGYADMQAAKSAYLADTGDATKKADYFAKVRVCLKELGWLNK
jgi:hypothetical protein